MRDYSSWGMFAAGEPRTVERPLTATAVARALAKPRPLLPYGNGRSQGDSCLNTKGGLVDMRGLNHFLAWEVAAGVLTCEAGVLLADILALVVPQGWFLPVTPGTKYITVGGAIANDVHGKNHHQVGTFGHHVRRFELVRSTGEILICSPTENTELFRATIGGLGLTGVITWAEITLRPITSQFITEKRIRLSRLDDFFAVAGRADHDYEYTVAWVDCLARGKKLSRGSLILGNHAAGKVGETVGLVERRHVVPRLTVPVHAPDWFMGRASIKAFNWLWLRKERQRSGERRVHFNSFFYPLDVVGQWNNVYGRRGFYQYQFVVPHEGGRAALAEILDRIAASQLASFLSTMKYFGDKKPAGLLSFPRPGIALAVDFANHGQVTLDLFSKLDEIVRAAGGALYPGKDSRMPPAMFAASFPRLPEFKKHVDPALSSDFWCRVTSE